MNVKYFDAIGIDWQTSLLSARKMVDKKCCLQGNLDPRSLLKKNLPFQLLEEIRTFYKKDKKLIFNLGHGVLPNTDEITLKKLVKWIKTTTWK